MEQPHRTGRAQREALAALLLLGTSLVVFFWPATLGGRVLLPADLIFEVDPLWRPLAPEAYSQPANQLLSDQVYAVLPWKLLTRHSLVQGKIPLWNPYTNAGLPFVGNAQSAVFSPFNLAGDLLPLAPSYVVTAILRLIVAGIFTYLFAREIGTSRWGALLAMFAFTFSGPMVVWLGYPLSPVVAWLPAILLATERALTRRSGLYAVLGGVAIGAQFLGGHPETSFHVVLVWTAYALYRALSIDVRRLHRLAPQLLRTAGTGLLGVALAAVQLFPFFDALAQSSILSSRQASAHAGTSGLIARLLLDWRQWPTVVTALLPNYFGTPLNKSYLYPYSNYVEQDLYAGVLPLALALISAAVTLRTHRARRTPAAPFLVALVIISLGTALSLPLLTTINFLPLLRIANNGRMRLIYVFAVSLLAGLGLDHVLADRVRQRALSRVLAVLVALSLLLIVFALAGLTLLKEPILRLGRAYAEEQWGTPYYSRPLEHYYAQVEARYERHLQSFLPTNLPMYLPVLVPLLYLGSARWLGGRSGVLHWRAAAAIGVTVMDLFLIGLPFNPTVSPDEVFPVPDAVEFIHRDADLYRVVGTGLTLYPNSGMVVGLYDVRGYDAVLPQRYVDLVDRVDGHYRHGLNSLFVEVNSPLLDLLNTKYALADRPLDGRWKLVYEGQGTVNVYRNPDALPRAFIVHEAEIVDGPTASLARVTDPAFDFRRSVVLERMPEDWTPPAAVRPDDSTVRIAEYEPNEVVLEVETATDGLLVLTDTYAPGWRAYLDGVSVPVHVANHAFRAVSVPPGHHWIGFRYQPMSFLIGLWGSILASVTALVVIALILIRRRRRGQ